MKGPYFVKNIRYILSAAPPYHVIAKASRKNSSQESAEEATEKATRIALCLTVCDGLSSEDLEKYGVLLNK